MAMHPNPSGISRVQPTNLFVGMDVPTFAPAMSNPATHFSDLLALLRREKEEDFQQYRKLVQSRPLGERIELGFTWHPLRVVQTGFTFGEKAFVTVERTGRLDEPHQFRAGQMVNFYTTQPHVEKPDKQGVINFVERNRMKIVLNSRDVPDWLFGVDGGRWTADGARQNPSAVNRQPSAGLGVDLLFDERTYVEMERALAKVMAAGRDRLAELRDILTGKRPPSFDEPNFPIELPHLNASQNEAVNHILAARDVAVVHGPPGTGKTTTLVAAIGKICEREATVLVTAPSNTAADLLTERLANQGLNVVRVGNISRVDEAVVSHTLDYILAKHPEAKHIKKVKLEAAELRRQARKHKRSFGYEERREREHLKHQARELEAWVNTLEDRLLDQILTSAQAIICTLVGAAHPVLERYKFRTCVMDEAAQALEPAAWIPILKSSRIILAGDPFQLPPTVKNLDAARGGLSKTLMERCLELHPGAVHLLDTQYRMHRAIMGFSNEWFYGGALRAHDSVVERRLLTLEPDGETLVVFEPVVFVDTAGCGFDERVQKNLGRDSSRAQSRYNPEEALLVREHLLQLVEKFAPDAVPSVAVISPYREQVNYLEETFRADATLAPFFEKKSDDNRKTFTVNTIDGFQGQERDVVYLSLVRSNAKNEIGFLSDYRRMNVAMTRARMLLVVVGDSATIGKNKFYEAFLNYCEREGRYDTAWAYMK